MRNHREHPRLNGGVDAIVTYARMPSQATSPGDDEPAGPVLTGIEVPFAERRGTRGAPEVHADRPDIDPAVAADLLGEKRRPRLLRFVMLAAVVAIVAGVGVLAAAYNAAVNVPADRSAMAKAADEAAVPSALSVVRAVGAVGAVDTVASEEAVAVDAPSAAIDDGPADVAVEPETASAAAAGDAPAVSAPPAPRERPAGPAQQARSQPAPPPSDQAEMDRLMSEVDTIIASARSAPEPAGSYPPAPATLTASPQLVVPPPAQQPLVVTPPATVAEAPPPWTEEPPPPRWWRIAPLRQRLRRGAPQPPADIPEAPPSTPGWW